MSADGYDVRPAWPQDASAFCRLSNSLYARPVDEAYYQWQFFGRPAPTVLSTVWAVGGDLAGCYGLQVRLAGPGALRVGWAIDIMVAPAHQRRGLFRRLACHAAEQAGTQLRFVMANPNADAASRQALDWRRVESFTTWVAPAVLARPLPSTLQFLPRQRFADWADVLAPAQRRDGTGRRLLHTNRTAAYLDWRFSENPRYDYAVYQVTRRDVSWGYMVLKVFRDPQTARAFGDIVDMWWTEDDYDALVEALRFAISHFASRGVDSVATWLQTRTLLDAAGAAAGFRPTTQVRYCCAAAPPEDPSLVDANRWFLTMADAEVY